MYNHFIEVYEISPADVEASRREEEMARKHNRRPPKNDIQRECEKIQRRWTPEEERRRSGLSSQPYEFPRYSFTDIIGSRLEKQDEYDY